MYRLVGLLLSIMGFASVFAQSSWTLDECISYAHKNNLQIKQYEILVEQSQADHKQSRFDLLPDFNVYGSHGYNWGKSIDPFTNTFATDRVRSNNFYLNGNWVLFQGMRKQNAMQATQHGVEVRQKQLEAFQDNISIQITNSYLQILYNTELLKVAEEEVTLSQVQLERIERLVDAGAAPKGEMYDIKAQKAQEELDVVNLANQVDLSYLGMIQLLQLSGDSAQQFRIFHPSVDDVEVVEPSVAYQDVYSTALESRPEIAGAKENVLLMEKSADMTKSSMIPSLSVSGSFGSGYSGLNAEPDGEAIDGDPQLVGFTSSGDDVFIPRTIQPTKTKGFGDQLEDNLNERLSLNLNIPIFNRLTNKTNYQKAKLDIIYAEHDLQIAKDQLRTDVQNAYADLLAAHRKFVASEEAVNALEESFKYAEKRYEQNAINGVDYNETKTRLMVARAELLRAKYEYIFNSKIVDFYRGVPISLQ